MDTVLMSLLLIASVTALASSLVTLKVDGTTEPLDVGSDVVIRCDTEIEVTSATHTLQIYAERPEGAVPVVTNQVIEDAFRNRMSQGSRRYTAFYRVDTSINMRELNLNISDIQIEDAGMFYCVLSASNQQTQSNRIIVAVKAPVLTTFMAAVWQNGTLQDVPDGTEISLSTGTPGGIACLYTVNSYVLNATENITVNGVQSSLFDSVSAPALVDGTTGTYQYVVKYMTSEPDYRLNDAVVRCNVSTPGSEDQGSAYVRASVTFAPVILCPDVAPKAIEGGDGMLTCTVRSNPPLNSLTLSYGETLTDSPIIITEGTVVGEKYTIERQDDGDTATVTITFNGLTPAFFDSFSYRLRAMSALGQDSRDFSFTRDVTSGSGLVHPCVALLLLTTLFVTVKSLVEETQ